MQLIDDFCEYVVVELCNLFSLKWFLDTTARHWRMVDKL